MYFFIYYFFVQFKNIVLIRKRQKRILNLMFCTPIRPTRWIEQFFYVFPGTPLKTSPLIKGIHFSSKKLWSDSSFALTYLPVLRSALCLKGDHSALLPFVLQTDKIIYNEFFTVKYWRIRKNTF